MEQEKWPITDTKRAIARAIGKELRATYEDVVTLPLPQRISDLVLELQSLLDARNNERP